MTVVFPLWFKYLPDKNYRATTIWPFIILRDKELKENAVLMNHERIHLAQQRELLIVFFYLIYFAEYVKNRIKGEKHLDAYFYISSEREAYFHGSNLNYLKTRKLWANFRKETFKRD
jgi:hypothetical protein